MKILYLTYDGLLDPLGQSQILPYLLGLAKKKHAFFVISFEKPDMLNSKACTKVQVMLKKNNIVWRPLSYHKSPSALATFYDVVHGIIVGNGIVRKQSVHIIHARSYVASLIALGIRTSERFLFDMRGFWPEERIEGGIWKRSSYLFKLAKWFEEKFFAAADHVIVLTHAAKNILQKQYHITKPITVIPTCADTALFSPQEKDKTLLRQLGLENSFILTYAGSIGTWYLFDEMLDFFLELCKTKPHAHFLLLVNDPEQAKQRVHMKGISSALCTIKSVARPDMPKYLSLSDASIFFIKPTFSKKGSCPSKLGECLAMGIAMIISSGIGDCDVIIKHSATGVIVKDFNRKAYVGAISQLWAVLKQKDLKTKCRAVALQELSLQQGVKEYDKTYHAMQ